jgi:hypothetical protein
VERGRRPPSAVPAIRTDAEMARSLKYLHLGMAFSHFHWSKLPNWMQAALALLAELGGLAPRVATPPVAVCWLEPP